MTKAEEEGKHTSGVKLPYLRNLNVRWWTFDRGDLLEMYFQEHELDRFGLVPGDILVREGGEPGRAAIWQGRFEGVKFQKALHRLRCYSGVEARFVVSVLEHLGKSKRLESYFAGSTIKHFTGESFARMPFPLPPVREQNQIVAEVAENLSQIEAAEVAVEHCLRRAARLRQSILRRAFEGKLVPQDPQDEPASVLLERLRPTRSSHGASGVEQSPVKGRVRRATAGKDGVSTSTTTDRGSP